MPALIAFRALQGLGAGAIQPTAMTIIGDIYSIEERAKVQGYVASVWAISAVVGPTLGGVFVDFLDWRWIFFVNVPARPGRRLGAVPQVRRAGHPAAPSDRRGRGGLLIAGASLLILGLLEGGVWWPWFSAAQRRHPGSAAPSCWSSSGWSSGGRPSPSCPAGCSAAGC